jgi:hypothetical protein
MWAKETIPPRHSTPLSADEASIFLPNLGPCCVQAPRLLVQIQVAPMWLSAVPATRAVLPSAAMETARPCCAFPTASNPTSLVPCWVQTPPLLVQTQAAPAKLLSVNPPTMAVSPSAEMDTELP